MSYVQSGTDLPGESRTLPCPFCTPIGCMSSLMVAGAAEWFGRLMEYGQAHSLHGNMCGTALKTSPLPGLFSL